MASRQIKTKAIAEFGDFQTPSKLALCATQVLVRAGVRPRAVLEPTCGRGAFLNAAAQCFPDAAALIGFDINSDHLAVAQSLLSAESGTPATLHRGNFFEVDWPAVVVPEAGPWLILGNPPWVTSSELGTIASMNVPEKSNFQGHAGILALTGKANFDISEWMLLRYLDWLSGQHGAIAVLCKTAVARKILAHLWKKHVPFASASIYKIDALKHFGAAVDACFFVLCLKPDQHAASCEVFDNLDAQTPSSALGWHDGHLVSDMPSFLKVKALLGPEKNYVWRSGIKHDCAKVMELFPTEQGYKNGLGQIVTIENDYLFPMLKSSDVGNGRTDHRAYMLVTQRSVGEETRNIAERAPMTWHYLNENANILGKRGSSIYRNKPDFSIFGVGPYSFASWKVAISGFYKKLHFQKVGPVNDRPVVFDDTVYFLSCQSEEEADFLIVLLTSQSATDFFNAIIHWQEKRPITVEVLRKLSLEALATQLGCLKTYRAYTSAEPNQMKPQLALAM
ncbi:SAM-dependent methyltransferase [Roseomonas mucosa]